MFVGVVKVRLENVAWVGMILNFVNRKANLFFHHFHLVNFALSLLHSNLLGYNYLILSSHIITIIFFIKPIYSGIPQVCLSRGLWRPSVSLW
jgi:hypothetical protein